MKCILTFLKMFYRFSYSFVLIMLSCWFSSTQGVMAAEVKQLTFAYEDKQNFPYYLGDTAHLLPENPGFSVEFLMMLEKEIPSIKINFVRMPWKRCLELLGANRVDGTFNASFKPDRLALGVYPMKNGVVDDSRRMLILSYQFYRRKNTTVDWDGKQFINLEGPIGGVLGYSAIENLKTMGFLVDDGAKDSEKSLIKLISKRVNLIVGAEMQVDFIVKGRSPKYDDVEMLSTPFEVKPYYLILSHEFVKNNPELSEKIWDTIAALRETQAISDLYKKYFEL